MLPTINRSVKLDFNAPRSQFIDIQTIVVLVLQRDPSMSTLKVNVDVENGTISVYNDGKGIPVVLHKEHNIYVPELIFGHLLTSSNFDDKEKRTVGGRNGFGMRGKYFIIR